MSHIKIIAGDKNVISFRPELKGFFKSTNAAILLQQIIYWSDKNDGSFYKFVEPCDHDKYKVGDSWCEELYFSRKEFVNAMAKLKEYDLVSTKINMERVTYYTLNIEATEAILSSIYGDETTVQKGNYITRQRDVMQRDKGTLDIGSDSNFAETTTEKKSTSSSNETTITSMAEDGEFNANYSELRMGSQSKFLGGKETSFKAYLGVKKFVNIKIIAFAYKQYSRGVADGGKVVGLGTFIDNEMFLGFMPEHCAVELGGVMTLGKRSGGMFYPNEGEAMRLDDETFVKMLHGGKIKFQADKLREI